MKKYITFIVFFITLTMVIFGEYNIIFKDVVRSVKTFTIRKYKIKYFNLKELENKMNIDNLSTGKSGGIITYSNVENKTKLYISNIDAITTWKVYEVDSNILNPINFSKKVTIYNNKALIIDIQHREKKLNLFQYDFSTKKINLLYSLKDVLPVDPPKIKYNENYFVYYILNGYKKDGKNNDIQELYLYNIKDEKNIKIVESNGISHFDVNKSGNIVYVEYNSIKYYNSKDKTIKKIEFDKLYPEIIMDEPYFVTFLNEKDIAIYSNEKLVIFDIEKWNIKDVIYDIPENIVGLTGLNDGSILVNIYDYKGE
ncbi:hypothetical protein SAMN02745164_02085 [Marinitoga hydrogenitolerans DSM 16785]|uniref:Uncharacterized protein n=1 Tax=Marinitoga hydrogenitolerans (strain DSM 16785 / JCM 12826 / AT1271) TaxID=1122195 RepID=A0A1M5A4J3_MARH1|nr:hypothetical protein [Marinitoga hydrogenitolerans]SHF24772.1 hypothetical protein SAMN02745164_02085 [Marinitoga hydrogenitolerans DSM 16785]